jgi:hypothetical protein
MVHYSLKCIHPFYAVYMNIPVGLVALCLLCWSLRSFELEQTMPEISWSALRAEFADNFDYVGVSVYGFACLVPELISLKVSFGGGNGLHGARV